MNLDHINQLFQSIWANPEQIPGSLANWQAELSQFLDGDEAKNLNFDDLEKKMNQWQETLEKNREVLQAHQIDLAKQIQEGDPSFIAEKQAKKFR